MALINMGGPSEFPELEEFETSQLDLDSIIYEDEQLEEEGTGRATSASDEKKELIKKRSTERQRRYRQGRKNKELEIETALEQKKQEIQLQRKEHEDLKAYSFTLETLRTYKEYFVDRLRGAAAIVSKHSTEAASTVFNAMTEATASIWEKATYVSDDKLRICIKYLHWMPKYVNKMFISRLSNLLAKWKAAETPEAKAAIEHHIASIYDTRKRLGWLILQEYPEKGIPVLATSHRDEGLGNIVARSRVLEDPMLLRAVQLTPEQRETLTRHLEDFRAEYCNMRERLQHESGLQERQHSVDNSAASSATGNMLNPETSLSGLAQSNIEALDARKPSKFAVEEVKLRLKYGLNAMEILTPLQLAFVSLSMALHFDYFDVAKAYTALSGVEVKEIGE